jgi:cell division protease FtsH
MTFAPSQGLRSGMSIQRTVLFWVMMIALAAVLWQMASKSTPEKSVQSISYSDFMSYVDQNNIASATLLLWQSTAEIRGKFRQPAQDFIVTIRKEVIPDLTERLRKQGTSIEVTETKNANWLDIVMSLAPFFLLLSFFIYIIKLKMANRRLAAGTRPSTGPLGD